MIRQHRADPTIDAALTLLRRQPPGTSSFTLTEDLNLKGVDWRKFIAFSSAHFVLQALIPPLLHVAPPHKLPEDVRSFLNGFHEANAARNTQLTTATLDIAAKLNAIGTKPVILKGGAFLFDADVSTSSWRFMSDVDLLIPPQILDEAVAALNELGYSAVPNSKYDPESEAHYPPLVSPCATFSVELHTRLFGLDDFDLCPDDLRARALPITGQDAELSMPSPEHRLAHLLAHAQLHNRNYTTNRLVLKDILDISMLCQGSDRQAHLQNACGLFKSHRNSAAVSALLTTWAFLIGASCHSGSSHRDERWTHTAIAKLYQNNWHSWASIPFEFVSLELHRLTREHGHAARRINQILRPASLAGAAQTWFAKQRQRHWT